MLWAPCIRVDLPVDAPSDQVRRVAMALDSALGALTETAVSLATVAVSAAALERFARAGFEPLLQRVAALADSQRIELVGTAAHGALLPLLPPREAERQIELNDAANRRWFGDLYRPGTLWPPALAASPGLVEIARDLGFSSLLVDETAPRAGPAPWPGDRIDAVAGSPGFFLLPCSRAGSAAFAAGHIRGWNDLRPFVPPASPADAYVISAVDLQPGSGVAASLGGPAAQGRLTRLRDLFEKAPLDRTVELLPCSQRSTLDELERGLPFAAWFDPENERHAAKWRLMLKLLALHDRISAAGEGSMPEAGTLRAALDAGWRESGWREPALAEAALEEAALPEALHQAVGRLHQLLESEAAGLKGRSGALKPGSLRGEDASDHR